MEKVNIGIVGVGDISGIYLKNLHGLFKELRVVGVCDLIREKAERAKAQYNIPKIYDTMYDLIADPEVDIVLNLTRPNEHYGVSRAALEGGKHVYSEKPLAARIEDGRALVALAEEKGLMLGGAPDTFLGAGIQTCRRIIDSGFIGDIIGASAAMICHGHESWHPDPEFYYGAGGGPMLDMGPYYITALINLLGEAKAVTGITRTSFRERTITSAPKFGKIIPVEAFTHVTGMIEFTSGAVANITTTFDVHYDKQAHFEVYGSEGTLAVPDPNIFGGPIMIYRPEEKRWLEMPLTFGYSENSRGLGLADMAKAITTDRTPRASYKQTLHVLEVMTAFERSSAKGAREDIISHFERVAPMQSGGLPGILD